MDTLYLQVIERFTKLGLAAKTKIGNEERDLITLPSYIPKGDVGVGVKDQPARGAMCEEEGCVLAHAPALETGAPPFPVIKAVSRVDELRHMARAQEMNADAEDFEARLLTFTASDETIDRYGDKILVTGELNGKKYGKGWLLKEFRNNPVFMPFHSYRELPLGTALDTWTDQKGERKRLRMTVLMDDGQACAIAPRVLKAFQSRLMRTVSVGFLPAPGGVHVPADEVERKSWGLGAEGYLFSTQHLLENSAVSIPANPNAKLEGLSAGDVVRYQQFATDVREVAPELAYQIRHMLKTGAGVIDLAGRRLTGEDEVRDDPSSGAGDVVELARAVKALSDKLDTAVASIVTAVGRVAEAHGAGEGGQRSATDGPEAPDPYELLIRGFDKLGAAAKAAPQQ